MRRACPVPLCFLMSTFCLLPGCSHALPRSPHISSAVSGTPTDNSKVSWRSDHAAGAVALWLVLRGHGLQCSLIDILRTAGPSASAEQLLRQAASVTPFATIERLRPRDLRQIHPPALLWLDVPGSGTFQHVVWLGTGENGQHILLEPRSLAVFRTQEHRLAEYWTGYALCLRLTYRPLGLIAGGFSLGLGIGLVSMWLVRARSFRDRSAHRRGIQQPPAPGGNRSRGIAAFLLPLLLAHGQVESLTASAGAERQLRTTSRGQTASSSGRSEPGRARALAKETLSLAQRQLRALSQLFDHDETLALCYEVRSVGSRSRPLVLGREHTQGSVRLVYIGAGMYWSETTSQRPAEPGLGVPYWQLPPALYSNGTMAGKFWRAVRMIRHTGPAETACVRVIDPLLRDFGVCSCTLGAHQVHPMSRLRDLPLDELLPRTDVLQDRQWGFVVRLSLGPEDARERTEIIITPDGLIASRVLHRRPSPSVQGLRSTILFQGYRAIAEVGGTVVWFPSRVVVHEQRPLADGRWGDVFERELTIRSVQAHLPLDQSWYTPRLDPGTLVRRTNGESVDLPGGLELAEEAATLTRVVARKHDTASRGYVGQLTTPSLLGLTALACLCGLAAGVLIALVFGMRLVRPADSAQPG